ncbi:MAG: hypothetical protein P8186_09865 [Anaerolineae bacterium]|jgi:hypothetical protein
MRYHLYRSVGVIIMRIAGNIILIAGLLLSPILLIGIPKTLYNLVMNPEAVREGTFGVIFVAAFLLLFGAVFPNLFPNLAVDDKGLYVRFYIKWLFVPWQDVVSCQESFISALNPFSQHIYFVLAKRGLTPIHWLISLNQLGGWGPGFLVSKNITDYQDLARTIREHLDSN